MLRPSGPTESFRRSAQRHISSSSSIMSQDQPWRTDHPGQGWDEGDPSGVWTGKITIAEALENAARTAGDKPVEPHDAAAIATAEANAIGADVIPPGGVAAAAYMAVNANASVQDETQKTTLGDVLGRAASMIPSDKEVTREDAARAAEAEVQSNPTVDTRPGGVAATLAAAARVNERIF